VAGLHKIDATTFTIRLTRETPRFLYTLAMASTAVVPVEAVRMYKDRFSVNPVGTGPFMLKEADRKSTLRLLKNPNYYRVYPSVGAPGDAEKGLLKDAGKKLPLVDVLQMPLIEEPAPAALKFLRGELDWRALDRANFAKLVVRGPKDTFRVADPYAAKFNIYWTPGVNLMYMTLNLRDPILGRNKALRQALACALDPNALIDVLLNGRGHRMQSVVPFDLPGNERETGAVYYDHDVVAARKLLVEAGYPGGKGLPPLTVSFAQTDADTHNVFDLLRAQYAAIGVQLNASFTDLPTYLKATSGGNFQITYYGWFADYPDAENFYALLYGKNVAAGNNIGAFGNPAYDQAYEASRDVANGPARLAYFRTMNALVRDEVPIIPVYETLRFGILQKWVGNFKRNLFASEVAYVSVDMALKKKAL
jgi:ABC-type transport system substrate-binding protein